MLLPGKKYTRPKRDNHGGKRPALAALFHAGASNQPVAIHPSDENQLLNEADRLQTEVRIAPALDQASGGFDGLAEPDVGVRDAQQLPARFIEFKELKPKAHWVESAREKSLISQRFKIRQCGRRHFKYLLEAKTPEPAVTTRW
jgi:hypothetical protein